MLSVSTGKCVRNAMIVCSERRRQCANKLDEHSLVGIVRSDRHNVIRFVLMFISNCCNDIAIFVSPKYEQRLRRK